MDISCATIGKLSTISYLLPFRKKDVRPTEVERERERERRLLFPIPISFATRNIQFRDKSPENVETRATTNRLILYNDVCAICIGWPCRVSRGIAPIDHQKTNRFVWYETSLFSQTDSRAKGVAFCRRWYSSYLTLHRRPLFQHSPRENRRRGYTQLHTGEGRLKWTT